MNILQKQIKRIHRRKVEKRIFAHAKKFLFKGCYCFENSSIKPISPKNFNVKKCLKIHCNFSGGTLFDDTPRQHFLEYDYGEGKDILLLNDYAIGFYYEKKDL